MLLETPALVPISCQDSRSGFTCPQDVISEARTRNKHSALSKSASATLAVCMIIALPIQSKRLRSMRNLLRTSRRSVQAATITIPPPAEKATEVRHCIGHAHTCTLIYLHGYAGKGCEYVGEEMPSCYPWMDGGDRAPGLRVVLPTAPKLKQPWGDMETSWYCYARPNRNNVGNFLSLAATRERLLRVVLREIDLLKGAADHVFLGGLSQGCTVALDTYLRQASRLGLGGFVGSVGFWPSEANGFSGAEKVLKALITHETQRFRPVWLQCATDDYHQVPWKSLVQPSLRKIEGRLAGLQVRTVSGRGHNIDEWEGHILNDFMRRYACDAY